MNFGFWGSAITQGLGMFIGGAAGHAVAVMAVEALEEWLGETPGEALTNAYRTMRVKCNAKAYVINEKYRECVEALPDLNCPERQRVEVAMQMISMHRGWEPEKKDR